MDSSPLDLQGNVTGIIRPPPEVRVVVDKTAQFVARNGKDFEERILGSEEGKTAKFHFLRSYHPFHAYYEKRIRDFKEGRGDDEDDDEDDDDRRRDDGSAAELDPSSEERDTNGGAMEVELEEEIGSSKSTMPILMNPLARFAHGDGMDAPPALEFCLPMNLGLTAEDADVIKVTARYAAANGSDFVSKLAEKEFENPKFDFLNPSHTLFSIFSRLVDMYRRIILGSPDLKVAVESKRDAETVLKSAVHRWNWACARENKDHHGSSEHDDASKFSIDWTDFTVVETITFEEDELLESTTSIGAMAAASEPSGPLEKPLSTSGEGWGPRGADVMMESADDIHVVADYQPRLAGTDDKAVQSRSMIDPISGKVVPVEQMSEHLKVQLADPRGRVEHQRFLEKQKETGMAAGDSMVSSLMQFAEKRQDIFGSEAPKSASAAVAEGPPSHTAGPRHAPPPSSSSSSGGRGGESGNFGAGAGLQPVVRLPPPMPGMPGMPGMSGMQMYPPTLPGQYMSLAPPPAMGGRPVNNRPAWMMAAEASVAPVQPPLPPPQPPLPPPELPEAKRARVEEQVAPASSSSSSSRFSSVQPASTTSTTTISLQIQCADDPGGSSYNLHGQMVSVPAVDVKETVKVLKGIISALLGMPANKMNLRLPDAGPKDFIRDTTLVESAGLSDGAVVLLTARTRGGR